MLKNGESLKVANQLYESGYFDYAQPCFTRLMKVMNEFYEDQWGLNNTGQNGGNVGVDINAPEAWELTRGCNNITVAVIDQGVDLDHPDLAGNLLAGHDATDGGDGGLNGDCWGDNAHGTCCAGIIGAIDNMIGTIGVAHGCRIIPIRVSYAFEDTEVWDEDWIVEAINHAWAIVDADILSCSWGGGAASIPINNEINDALTLGRNGLGCVIAFSTGNNNTSVSWPANGNPDIIAVGAMSPCGERKRSSSNIWDLNPGVFPDPEDVSCDNEKWWGSNYGDELDLVAPGVFVPTTDIQGTAGYDTSSGTNGNYYLTFNGTSAATPHVAGVAALILSINPALTQDEVCDIIESTCKKTGSYSYTTTSGRTNGTWNNEMGYGLVNAYAAVNKASGGNISGPSVVCSSGNSTFSLIGSTAGLTIDWDCDTSVLTQVGDDTGSSYVVTANTWATGDAWVRANIITGCGDTITKQVTFQVGEPIKDDFHFVMLNISTGEYVSNFTNNDGNPVEICPNTVYELWTDYNGPFTVQDLDWMLPYGWEIQAQYGSNNRFTTYLEVDDNVHTGLFLTVQTEECGWGNMLPGFYFTEDYSCGGYYLLITPNPVNGEATLSIERGDPKKSELKSASGEKEGFDYNAEWDLEIYNSTHTLESKKTKLKGKSTTIQTVGWQEGVYIVRVKYKDEILTGKLVVKE